MSAAWIDGEKLIYLIGHTTQDDDDKSDSHSRVYTFNISKSEEQQQQALSHLGDLDDGICVTFMFKHFNWLYCIDKESSTNSINAFDLNRREQVHWCELEGEVESCTLYEDNIYILFVGGRFISMPLSIDNVSIKLHSTELAPMPITKNDGPLINEDFDQEDDNQEDDDQEDDDQEDDDLVD
ncbi:hypothetical protein SAMD00019534_052030 [Acytostelium subglobosum LB1]|uniref:hypothetical protein n=1 Tax=Acytostelium subglobosum LB1 TaxID=1410327 RepID=UPI000644B787|nr:hypothetical protein SAMD00019534_052030 [Acytostelium subglobosum LB1]GAM22028.1 hypothetical protein SAMD00019534_052030 [Acytostelium subglobosum LB1]|eukprot:XP_012755128.1 hypothetical protein SAMD00019534_052030 [Acytostelium subglobosum LB1]